jgi:hypothetical protein
MEVNPNDPLCLRLNPAKLDGGYNIYGEDQSSSSRPFHEYGVYTLMHKINPEDFSCGPFHESRCDAFGFYSIKRYRLYAEPNL